MNTDERLKSVEELRAELAALIPDNNPSWTQADGERFREVRVARTLSQRDLGAELGISYTYTSRIEDGTRRPSMRKLVAAAVIMDCSFAHLAYGRGQMRRLHSAERNFLLRLLGADQAQVEAYNAKHEELIDAYERQAEEAIRLPGE